MARALRNLIVRRLGRKSEDLLAATAPAVDLVGASARGVRTHGIDPGLRGREPVCMHDHLRIVAAELLTRHLRLAAAVVVTIGAEYTREQTLQHGLHPITSREIQNPQQIIFTAKTTHIPETSIEVRIQRCLLAKTSPYLTFFRSRNPIFHHKMKN